MKQALKDLIDVIEKGYDEAYLNIYCYTNKEATFTINIEKNEITAWATSDITPSDIFAKKLAKIEQIIKE